MRRPTTRSPAMLHAPGLFFLLALALSGLFTAPGLPPAPQEKATISSDIPAPRTIPAFHYEPVAQSAQSAQTVSSRANTPPVIFFPAFFSPESRHPASINKQASQKPAKTSARPTPTPTARPRLELNWRGIDFTPGAQTVTFTFSAAGTAINNGRDINVNVRPGSPCDFWDFRACVGAQDNGQNGLILITLHSGIGGDGQPLRHALEGTGFNQAGFSLDEILRRMEQMRGAEVGMRQGDRDRSLRVLAVERIPPAGLENYFSRHPLETLRDAAISSRALKETLQSGEPVIVIETCGWRHPEEWGQPGATDSTGSVYLVVMGE